MSDKILGPLQIREVFHLEFLRWFGRKLEADRYVLKGGVNLRLFFKSIRYSEDMDIDLTGVRVEKVKKTVMEILGARGLTDSLKSFGIE
ncbi:MAG: nucleotidyl transferase AbiEii/AbiGii toxin family protein, partial [Candidatus Omnitrophica bacterium]|nr:nucleotidyl transferase AbiEii/AbiGii toxin family protein [Candidatus Omnitrophota bacterium]